MTEVETAYKEAMDYIGSFTKSGERVKDLSRFHGLCEALGNPQDSLKFIHVAGTNGKGSVVSYCACALRSAGYRVGEFISPYIYDYTERISVNGRHIPREDVARLCEVVRKVVGDSNKRYSQFEITNAIAFLYFAESACDIVVLEAGVGGTLDSTNVVTTTLVSVITSISKDHTKLLGDTLEEIAAQKSGIIKPHSTAVISYDNEKSIQDLFISKAASVGADIVAVSREDVNIRRCGIYGIEFDYRGEAFATGLAGEYQAANASAAIEALRALGKYGINVSEECIREGIRQGRQPSRCEIIDRSPLTIIDGAHNPAAMKNLSQYLKKIPSEKVLIVGMSSDKDWRTALSYIRNDVDSAICVDDFLPNAVPATLLAEELPKATVASVHDALTIAREISGQDGCIVIAGSLYLGKAMFKNDIQNV